MGRQKLVIGVLTYCRADMLAVCLESIRRTTDMDGAVLVIANNSLDESYVKAVEALGAEYKASVLSFRKNRGTSAAWNAIARVYDCEQLVISNDDIRLHPGWQRVMNETLADPQMGLASLSLYNGVPEWQLENDPKLDPAGLKIVRYYCTYPTGAFLMMRREAFDRVGGFDENLWIGLEEVDFGIRAMRLGYRNANVGADMEQYKFASHYGSASGQYNSDLAYFERKHGVPFPLPKEFERELAVAVGLPC